ncbi:MAG TPA: serpin family protein [Candidatus Atribacteria bacterium]|nr:serpin family protein [Candidatus Atribacteria bacterium]
MLKFLSRQKRIIAALLSMVLLVAVAAGMTACSVPGVKADDLMKGIKAQAVEGKAIDERFVENTADFTIELFKKSVDSEKNSLVSPLSVMLALAMTANGADKDTLDQMDRVLGGDIPLDELNRYLYTYVKGLPSEKKSKLNIANSIWFRDDSERLNVNKDFLQTNADYYSADIYKAPFDNATLKDINNWVKANTDGMIDEILKEIKADHIMYLLNAIVFDAEWKSVYNKNLIFEGEFTSISGARQTAEFMNSEEYLYLDDGRATGFIKPYYNNNYSFVALLPNEGIDIDEYIKGLTGGGFLNTVKNSQAIQVNAYLPKFSYEYEIKMNDALKELGMTDAFDAGKADFSRLGHSTRGNIYCEEVFHKTFIAVDELGTRAGAVTKVVMSDESTGLEIKYVRLDRPFVYAIIDNATNLPVFIGTVLSID